MPRDTKAFRSQYALRTHCKPTQRLACKTRPATGLDRAGRKGSILIHTYQSNFMGSEGFIQNPATNETKRFHRDEKSWVRDPKVCVFTGIPIPEEPPLLKTRVHLRRDAAEQLRKELHRVGWHQVEQQGEPCWGASAEPQSGGVTGGLAAVSIRKRSSEISVVFQEQSSLSIAYHLIVAISLDLIISTANTPLQLFLKTKPKQRQQNFFRRFNLA